MHCKNEKHSNLLATLGNACTSLPSQPSPCCCSPLLMGASANAATNTTHCVKHETCAIQVNKNTARLWHRPEKTNSLIRSLGKDVHSSLPPAVEDSALSAPASLQNGLCICASHSACRTVVPLTSCRSLLRSKNASPFVFASLNIQLPNVDHLVHFHNNRGAPTEMWSDDGRDVDKSCDNVCFLKHRMALSQRLRPGMRAKGPLPLDPPLGRR